MLRRRCAAETRNANRPNGWDACMVVACEPRTSLGSSVWASLLALLYLDSNGVTLPCKRLPSVVDLSCSLWYRGCGNELVRLIGALPDIVQEGEPLHVQLLFCHAELLQCKRPILWPTPVSEKS